MIISRNLRLVFLVFVVLCGCSANQTKDFNILNYGAVANGKTLNTSSIQSAIDAAFNAGGGTVIIPPGIFLSGTIILKSNVNLHLGQGATLLGSPHIKDYKSIPGNRITPWHLIYADSTANISISGKGTIDGNGKYFWKDYAKDKNGKMITPRWIKHKKEKISPLIEIDNSKNITIENVTVKTGGGWDVHLFDCDLAKIQGINVINNRFSPNSDGIDLSGCRDVTVSNCDINTCDDAICMKTDNNSRETSNIAITNCIIKTLCVGIKFGSGSVKDMHNVSVSNCVITNSSRLIGIYTKKGGMLYNITITNITGNNNVPLVMNRPIQLMVEKDKDGKVGGIKNLLISNFICDTDGRILMTCDKGGIMKNIVLRDVILNYPFVEDPKPIYRGHKSSHFPKVADYPEADGARAAVVAKNIKNLIIDNLIVNWPESKKVPKEWRLPERIENGTTRIFKYDYKTSIPANFSILWGRYLYGGSISAIGKATSSNLPKYDIEKSTIKIIQ